MPTGMGVASPKFSKSDRKPKKTKHCTIPIPRKKKTKKKVLEKGNCPDKVRWQIKLPIKRCTRPRLRRTYITRKEKDES